MKDEAEWIGKEATPDSTTWVTDSHREDVAMNHRFKNAEDAAFHEMKLLEKMPRDPGSKRYLNFGSIKDKVSFLWSLLELHQGELREVYGYWRCVPAALPRSQAWYASKYTKDLHDFLITLR